MLCSEFEASLGCMRLWEGREGERERRRETGGGEVLAVFGQGEVAVRSGE